jgi:integrase
MTGCLYGNLEESGDISIGQSMFNKFKYLLTSYREYICSKGIECSELNIYELVKYIKRSVKIVFIPREAIFVRKLDSLIRNGRNVEAAIGILGAYLGMRKEEIISLKKQNFKIFKNDIKGSYVYFLGKGSKWRQVSLQFIPNIRHIKFLISLVLTDDGNDTVLKLKNEDAFEKIFSGSDSWGKLFPCGSHDMRRSFTTWNHMRGVPILKIALALGHEELKNMDHYNQDRFRDYNSIMLQDINMLPKWIPEGHAATLAITTTKTLKDTVMLELMKKRILNAKRRKRGKVVFYDTRFLVSTLKDLLKVRYKERQKDINYEGFYTTVNKKIKKDGLSSVPEGKRQHRKLNLKI